MYWLDDLDGTPSSFVSFVQIFSEKTATSLKSTTLVAYLIHVVLFKCTVTYWIWLIKNGLPLIGFPPEQFDATVEGDTESHFKNNSADYWFTSLSRALPEADLTPFGHCSLRQLKMSLINDAMFNMLAHYHARGSTSFHAHRTTGQTHSFFLILTWNCSNISKAK